MWLGFRVMVSVMVRVRVSLLLVRLQLRDGLVQLRNGGRDVGQLDDVAPGQGRYMGDIGEI